MLVYGNKEMASLVRRHTRKYASTAATVERLREELRRGNDASLRSRVQVQIKPVGWLGEAERHYFEGAPTP